MNISLETLTFELQNSLNISFIKPTLQVVDATNFVLRARFWVEFNNIREIEFEIDCPGQTVQIIIYGLDKFCPINELINFLTDLNNLIATLQVRYP